MKILLKGLNLLDPEQKLDKKADLLINDGIIEKIGNIKSSEVEENNIFDFNDMVCVPGLFDMHVHLREPGREDEETVVTGCNGAAAGGFTGIACMPNTNPAADSAEVIKLIKEKASNHLVDVYPVGAVSVDRKGEALAPIAELYEAGAVAFSDDGVAVKTAALLRNALEYAGMYNAPIIEHCEDESLADGAMNESLVSTQLGLPSIPTVAEDITVSRDILMAEYLNKAVHIAHISSKRSIELVREAKARGVKVTAEVTPHHFTLTDDNLKTYDTNYKMNPPLRGKADLEAVIEGLKDGTIDCIASDHAPHSIEEKEMEFIYAPNGILGLESQLGLTLSELVNKNHITLSDLVYKLSINPRRILNINVPSIKEGEKANLTIFDPHNIWTVNVSAFKSKSKNSPFDKRLLTGKPVAVINKGKMFYENELKSI
ncbi:MAG: dihydroorotase [Ignavibacteriae bacterium HGW-Ignavibacteriae-2]|jgi:dihydroorotase|nr:MAG: dihydroorotase [Ignavibacteriae bacterium HGW-Ignavibacteriae-2]